jgi:hypothetical protein
LVAPDPQAHRVAAARQLGGELENQLTIVSGVSRCEEGGRTDIDSGERTAGHHLLPYMRYEDPVDP